MTPAPPLDCIVAGAGIAGLAAAYELTRRGRRVVLLEAAAKAGGLLQTERADGFLIDTGPDSLLIQKPAGLDLCRELGLEDRLVPVRAPRTAYVLWEGRLHPLPEGGSFGIPRGLAALLRSRLFSPAGKLRIALEPWVPHRPARDEDESIGAFMRRRFGAEMVTRLAEPLLAGIHAGDVDRLSVAGLFPALAEAETRHGSVTRGLRLRGSPQTQGLFRSFPNGIGELVDAIESALPPGAIRLATPVTHVHLEPSSAVVAAGGEEFRARRLVLAIPAFVAADLLEPHDAEVARLCRGIPYLSSAGVVLAYPRDAIAHPLNGSGFVVPRAERGASILAATWVSSKWFGRAPDGMVLLRAFVGGSRQPALLENPDAALIDLAHGDLARILRIEGAPVFSRVYRWIRANPQHETGHLARVAAIDARLARDGRVSVTGSGYRGVGIPDCIAAGRATGARVAASLEDA